MLSVAELVRELSDKGLVKQSFPHKKWVRLSEDEYQKVQAVARALRVPDTQVLRALILRGMMK